MPEALIGALLMQEERIRAHSGMPLTRDGRPMTRLPLWLQKIAFKLNHDTIIGGFSSQHQGCISAFDSRALRRS